MAFVIHLQNLPRDATSSNVRDFFEGLHIADGGVHITNSYDGSVFITFTSETNAYTGMELDGRLMFGERIKLSLCTEEEKEERLASLQEEEQILQDCQEYDDNPYNFRTQHGSKVASSFGRQAPTLRAGEVDTHHQPLKYRYYIHILHVDKGVTEYHLRDFFKGVAAHIPEGGIVLDHNLSQAYVQFDNCRAFEISLKMDESVVSGRRVKIKMCSKNKFEKAKKYCSHFKVPYKGDKYKKPWNPEAEGLKFNRDEGRRQPEAFYMHVQNIDKSVKVYDLKMFLRGWAKYVPKDGIIFKEHKEAFRMSEAYVCFNSEEAFRSSLLMDGRALNETQVKITECTEKEFRENEKFGTDHGFSDFVKTNPPWEKHEKDGNVSHGASNAIRTSAPWEEGTKPFVPWETQSRYEEQPSSRAYQKARHFSEDTSQREFVGQGSRHTMHTSRNSDWDDMYKSRNQRLDDRPNQYTFQQPKRTVPFCVVISNLYCRAIVDDILSILSKVSIKPKRTEIRVAEDPENSFKRLAFVKLFNEECYHQALSLDRVWFGGEQLSISGCSEKDFYFKYTAADSSSVREHSTPNQQEAPQMDSQIPFLFLGDLDDSVSPKDIRNVFGVLSFSIPSDGIIIRPDVKGQGKYVAFVKFDDPEILIQAQEIWRGIDGGIQINDRKVFLSKCTSRMIVQYDLSRELKRFKFKAGNPNSGNIPKIDRRGRSDSPASVRIGQPSAAQGNPMYGHQSMYPATSRVPVYSGSLSERLRASLAATPNLNVLDFKPRSRSRSPLQQESKRRSQSWSRSVSRSRSRSVSRSRSRSVSRSRYRSVSRSHSRSVSRSRSRSRSRSYTRSRSRSRSRSLSPNQVRRSRSPVSDIFRRRQSSFSRSRSQSRGRSSSRSPRSLSSDNENSKPWGDNGDIPAFRINGRFIRISPLPIWANEVWIYDIFSDVNLNRDSILIKYLDKTPLHAYVECVTDDDFEKAIKRNGMIVGTDKIFVEPLGKNF